MAQADLDIEVRGVDVSSSYMDGTLRLKDKLNGASTLTFNLFSRPGTIVARAGDLVELRDQNRAGFLMFSGTVDSTSLSAPGQDMVASFITIKAVDHTRILDRLLIAEVFNAENAPDPAQGGWDPAEIVRHMVNQPIVGSRLLDEGITEGTIVDANVNIETMTFNYRTVSKALTDLAKVIGYSWRLNPDKSLDFFPPTQFPAAFNLTDANLQDLRRILLKSGRQSYRNRQYVRAGDIPAEAARKEKFVGDVNEDGEGRKTFNTAFPVSGDVTPIIRLNGIIQTVGRRGIDKDEEGGQQWFFSDGDQEISQSDTVELGLTPSDVLEVEYFPILPLLIEVNDSQGQADRATAEGAGTGAYEAFESNEEIVKFEHALDRGRGLLDQFSRLPETIDVRTPRIDIFPCDSQLVNLSGIGINDTFLVSDVTYQDLGGAPFAELQASYKAVDGNAIRDWTDFWRDVFEANRDFGNITKDQIVKIEAVGDQIQVSDADETATGDSLIAIGADTEQILRVGTSMIEACHVGAPMRF